MPCPGNASETCGAGDRIFIFSANCTGTPLPSYQACGNAVARALPYCDTSLPLEQRLDDLLGRLSLDDKIAMISPQEALGNDCGVHTAAKVARDAPRRARGEQCVTD